MQLIVFVFWVVFVDCMYGLYMCVVCVGCVHEYRFDSLVPHLAI